MTDNTTDLLRGATRGEIAALRDAVSRLQAENALLSARMETAERQIRELQEAVMGAAESRRAG